MRENESKNFWLQMTNDFFDSDRMLYLEGRPHGREYCLLYTKLLLKSIRTEGVLRLSEKLAYTNEMIAGFTRMPLEMVREGMALLISLDLVEIWDDGTIFLTEIENMVGSETKWAGKKRKTRENQSNKNIVPEEDGQSEDIVPTNRGHDEDIVQKNEDIDNIKKRKENNNKTNNIKREDKKENAPEARSFSPSVKKDDFVLKNKYGSYGWVELSDAEYAQLLDELGEAELARCIAYIDESAQSTGNRNHWQDWGLILRRCSRESWGIRQEKPAQKQAAETIGWNGAAYDEAECTNEDKAAAADELEKLKAYLAKLKAQDI